jgi:hypothetical protein
MGLIHWAKEKIAMNIIASLIERVFKNYITTALGILLGFAGVVAAVYNLIPGTLIWQGHNVANTLYEIAAVAIAVAGAIAKDKHIGINSPTLPTKVGMILFMILAWMAVPGAVQAQTTFSATTGAVAVYDAGSWEAATHITESLNFFGFGAKKTNYVYLEGHEFLASTSGFNLYAAGAAVQPDLAKLFSKTNVNGSNLSLKLGASLGNKIPTNGSNSHVAGLFNATFAYRASSTVSWVPFEYDGIVAPGGKVTHGISMSLTKYF